MSEPCKGVCPEGSTQCGPRCLLPVVQPRFHVCGAECLAKTLPCNGACPANTTKCGAEKCLESEGGEDKVYYECKGACVTALTACEGKCPEKTKKCAGPGGCCSDEFEQILRALEHPVQAKR